MIAADTSVLIAYLQGAVGNDIERADAAASAGQLVIPPVVVTELLSDPETAARLRNVFAEIAILPVLDGYWHRAGELRRLVKAKGLRAKTADALVAQSCIDHDVSLITRDTDFRHFARHGGLKLA